MMGSRPVMESGVTSTPRPSTLTSLLWLIPVALLGAVVYVVVAALQAEQPPPAKAAVVLSSSYPLTIEEAGGRRVVIAAKPGRIIPADSGMADILSALVEPRRIVALPVTVEQFGGARDFYVEHQEIPRFESFSAETLLSLKPDLLLAVVFRDNAATELVEQRGVPVLRFEHFRTFAGIRSSFMTVGAAVGEEQKARALAGEFDKRLAAVEKAVSGRPKPRALWYSKYDQGFAVGTGESQDEILRRAGAANAAAELNLVGHVHFTFEQMLKLKPDSIVVSGDQGLDSQQARTVLGEPLLAELPALKERRIAAVPDRFATSLSQYAVEAVEILARQLHPHAFEKRGMAVEPETGNLRPETR